MDLKSMLNTFKRVGYITSKLDQFLMTDYVDDSGEDRKSGVNSPSSCSRCSREIVYSRTGTEKSTVDPRTQRIFDNGSGVHERLQKYLTLMGMLKMEEVPVFDVSLNVFGHCDGLISISDKELAVLEIKSMNTNSFTALKEPKPEHIEQAQVYMYCLEDWRLHLKALCKNKAEFMKYLKSPRTRIYYSKIYKHLKDGNKYSKAEKISFKIKQHLTLDEMLWNLSVPITKMLFLYENKNDQEIKEFCVDKNEELVKNIKIKFKYINNCLENEILPDREGTSKSCNVCRFCNYKSDCWIV